MGSFCQLDGAAGKKGFIAMSGLEGGDNRLGRRRGGRRLSQIIVGVARTLVLILTYYTCSIGLTFYQKGLFKDFKFPLTVVIVHLFMKFVLAGFCRLVYTAVTGVPRITLGWDVYWRRVLPPGAAAGIDIGLSQWSLEFITVALYTMSKSTALLFILIFAIFFKLEEMKWSVVVLVVLIAGGLFMFTYKYTQFNLFGFLLVIIASVLSGLRWTLSQLVMQKSELGLGNPIDMVYHIQPWMTASLLPLAVIMEAIATSRYGFRFEHTWDTYYMWGRVMFGAVIAFFMEVSEYLVVCYTSSLTFSISGVAKEIMTLSLAVYYYNETLSTINVMGLFVCILGIIFHVVVKATAAPVKASSNSGHNGIGLTHVDNSQKMPLLSETDQDEQELFTR